MYKQNLVSIRNFYKVTNQKEHDRTEERKRKVERDLFRGVCCISLQCWQIFYGGIASYKDDSERYKAITFTQMHMLYVCKFGK